MAEEKELFKTYTKDELRAFVTDIESQVVENNIPTVHTMLALNDILKSANAHELLDEDMKSHLRDLWLKVKGAGLELMDPPLLFGAPPLPQEVVDGEAEVDGAAQ